MDLCQSADIGALYMIPFDRDGCFAEIRFYKEYT